MAQIHGHSTDGTWLRGQIAVGFFSKAESIVTGHITRSSLVSMRTLVAATYLREGIAS